MGNENKQERQTPEKSVALVLTLPFKFPAWALNADEIALAPTFFLFNPALEEKSDSLELLNLWAFTREYQQKQNRFHDEILVNLLFAIHVLWDRNETFEHFTPVWEFQKRDLRSFCSKVFALNQIRTKCLKGGTEKVGGTLYLRWEGDGHQSVCSSIRWWAIQSSQACMNVTI